MNVRFVYGLMIAGFAWGPFVQAVSGEDVGLDKDSALNSHKHKTELQNHDSFPSQAKKYHA
jgi:hypothetical protein